MVHAHVARLVRVRVMNKGYIKLGLVFTVRA